MSAPAAGAAPESDPRWSYRLTAENHARDSDNRIHDDAVAAEFGFRGGLVPGVDVYAYLCLPPAREWGMDWLRSGGMAARFGAPVYDGDLVSVNGREDASGAVDLVLTTAVSDGDSPCATGRAVRRASSAPPDPADWPRGDPATRGAPASPRSLAVGTPLVPLELGFHADKADRYLAEVGETLPLYREEGVAHPGWLLRFANFVLADHVRLGPWIHVSSDAVFFAVVPDGARLEVRALVTAEYERRGHRFVELDVLVLADGSPAQRITHTAIHTPRPPTAPRPPEP